MTSSLYVHTKEERIARILDATLEVFSEFSFDDATTGEIAARARVSKRDIYAYFPNKQALLMGIVIREMQRQDEIFRTTVVRSEQLRGLRSKLEEIGIAVVAEILSPKMGVVRRLVVSESINQPFLGDLFFEGGVTQRCQLIANVLTSHLPKNSAAKGVTPQQAARRYLSTIAYFPSTMMQIGLQNDWSEKAIKAHVANETEVFLKAHPVFA
jgi:TetR/AcrR family transcriptional regulator, mexJK operon transcriptional repressor